MMKAQFCFAYRNKEAIRANTEKVGEEHSMDHTKENQHMLENNKGGFLWVLFKGWIGAGLQITGYCSAIWEIQGFRESI